MPYANSKSPDQPVETQSNQGLLWSQIYSTVSTAFINRHQTPWADFIYVQATWAFLACTGHKGIFSCILHHLYANFSNHDQFMAMA